MDKLADHLNNGIRELPIVRLVDDAMRFFPERNNHNTHYYSTKVIFEESFREALLDIIQRVPLFEGDASTIDFPESGRCSKCNCLFRTRYACVTLCDDKQRVTTCLECAILRWLIDGSTARGKARSPLYLNEWTRHRGFSPCPVCRIPLALCDFRKLKIP